MIKDRVRNELIKTLLALNNENRNDETKTHPYSFSRG